MGDAASEPEPSAGRRRGPGGWWWPLTGAGYATVRSGERRELPRTRWEARAACRSLDPDALFVKGKAQNLAKQICRECPVQAECLAEALDKEIEYGVWGGMTERERRLLRRGPGRDPSGEPWTISEVLLA